MIHQCFFDDSQRDKLFFSPVYRGFGMSSRVNPNLTRNCPELVDPKTQSLLSEYSAMLHLWRNPELDPDPWIGFTSYRQLQKFPTFFEDRQTITNHLAECDVLGWAAYAFFDIATGRQLTMGEQGEWNHPGLTMCLWHLLMARNEPLPRNYMAGTIGGIYANYWAMSKENFDQYMTWSYPLVRRCLERPDEFIRSNPRSIAYLVERLFVCWYELSGKRVRNIAPVVNLACANHYRPPEMDSEGSTSKESFLELSSWNVSLLELCRRHRALPNGIVHVGAHYAEERESYRLLGATDVLWIEADPVNMPQLAANIADYSRHRALQACLSEMDGQPTSFYRTNNR